MCVDWIVSKSSSSSLNLACLLHIKCHYLACWAGIQYCYGCIEGFGGDDCLLFGQSHLHIYAHCVARRQGSPHNDCASIVGVRSAKIIDSS